MMELRLSGLTVSCIIGERPDERTRLQELRLDVVLEIDPRAGETDSLADTVDYAALAERLRATLAAAECQMIERAARLAVDCCFEQPFVRVAEVTVTKTGAIAHLASASARCRLTRAEYGAGRRN
jgi:dihydroneopterin aldolase